MDIDSACRDVGWEIVKAFRDSPELQAEFEAWKNNTINNKEELS